MKNAILLVLDACRSDFLGSHAPEIAKVANKNVRFENAVVPARWSLPSHASIFSGEYPHEHGLCSIHDEFESVPLVENFSEDVTTYAVSANPFANTWKNFDRPFDEFVDTLNHASEAGLDMSRWLQRQPPVESRRGRIRKYARLLKAVITHDHRRETLYNLALTSRDKARNTFDVVERIPHPFFQRDVYRYSPTTNTDAIRSILTEQAHTDDPFFLFSNYMDTHSPYFPSTEYQLEYLGRTLSFRQMRNLNQGIGNPCGFLAQTATDALDSTELDTIRSLYAGCVAEVDDHVGGIFETLEQQNLAEETLVIITADHGENLGEQDPRGGRRMGHVESVSDHLLKVPLIVINPSLSSRTVERPVPMMRIFDLLDGGLPTNTRDIVEAFDTEGPVVSECPATRGDWSDAHSAIPRETIRQQTGEHTCIAYECEYKVAMTTDGGLWAWRDGTTVDIESVPREVLTACREHLHALEQRSPVDSGTSEGDDRFPDHLSSQLEDLGYL